MTTNMEQIIILIQDSVMSDMKRFIPRIENRSSSYHELESIFFGHGNGYNIYMEKYDNAIAWNNLTQKEKNLWNSKAKKAENDSIQMCKAKKKDGSDCTTPAKDNGLCGKHKEFMKSHELAKIFASSVETKVIKMKRKKIDGKIYDIDEDNKAFDIKTKELAGIYNPDTKKIEQDDDFFDNSSLDGGDSSCEEIVDSDNE